jgi:hypothetical protein
MAGADPQLRSADDAEYRGGVTPARKKTKHRRGLLSGVQTLGQFHTGDLFIVLASSLGLLNSECPQQNRANESEHGAYSEHIPLQGKLHGSASLVDVMQG